MPKKLTLDDVPAAVTRARKHLSHSHRLVAQIMVQALDSKLKDPVTARRFRLAKIACNQVEVTEALLWELPGLDWKKK
jgi:hypothetical protein